MSQVHSDADPYPFDWAALVPLVLHPTKLLIIEAIRWTGEPVSAKQLEEIFDEDQLNLSIISYHMNVLARYGTLTKVGQRQVRGALETFYFFTQAK